ncbi:MAG: hypothetical protein ACF8PN_02395 [Phycisphaerales bacterium]
MNFDPTLNNNSGSGLETDHGDLALGQDEFDLLGSGKKQKKLRDSTLALGAIILVAGGVLYGMRIVAQKSASASTGDESVEVKIKEAVNRMIQSDQTDMRSESERVLAGLSLDRSEVQVPLDEVKKNPFFLIGQAATDPTPRNVEPANDSEYLRRQQERRREELARRVSRFEISSVMGRGDSCVAIVNNQVVQVGDYLDDFQVIRIEPLRVTLDAEGLEFEITLGP